MNFFHFLLDRQGGEGKVEIFLYIEESYPDSIENRRLIL